MQLHQVKNEVDDLNLKFVRTFLKFDDESELLEFEVDKPIVLSCTYEQSEVNIDKFLCFLVEDFP